MRQSGFTVLELLVVSGLLALLALLFFASLRGATGFARLAVCKSNLRQQGLALAMYVQDFHHYPLSQDPRLPTDSVWSGSHLVSLGSWAKVLKPYVQAPGRSSAEARTFLCPQTEMVTGSSGFMLKGFPVGSTAQVRVHGVYGYNAYGTALDRPDLKLGLGREWQLGIPSDERLVAESLVASPSSMIAVSDSRDLSPVVSPVVSRESAMATTMLLPSRRHRGSSANVVFCDGHVERLTFRELVEPTETARRRWNNDHQAHPETW